MNSRHGNQQPGQVGMPVNGSETDRISRTEVAATDNSVTRRAPQEGDGIVQSLRKLKTNCLYGSSVNGIAMNLNVSKEEAQRLIDLYFKAYPGVLKYVQNTHKMAEWNHFVTTPFGQRKQQYGTNSVFKYTAAFNAALRNSQNVRVQSTTSTAGLITFAAANEGIKTLEGRSICTVYDSAEFEVPLSRAAEAVEQVFYYFDDWPVENFDWLDLPIGSEVEIGINWGQCTDVHRGVTQSEIEAIIAKMQGNV